MTTDGSDAERARRLRRQALGVLAGLAGLVALGWLGAWWWWSRLPRPNLLEFVPPEAGWVVQIREGRTALKRLRALDPGGRLFGPNGLADAALRAAVGPTPNLAQVAEFSHDEALAATLPGGGFLAVCRLGVRERLADRLFTGVRLVRTRRVAGGTIRLVRFPGGDRVAWTITSGVLMVSRDESTLIRILARRGGPVAGRAAVLAAAVQDAFSIRVLHLPPAAADAAVAIALERRRTWVRARYIPPAGSKAAAWLAAFAPTPLLLPGAALRGLPAGCLAAVATGDAGWMAGFWPRPSAREAGDAQGAPEALLRALAIPEWREHLAGLRPAVALLGIEHGGILPMPQLAAVFGGAAGRLSEAAVVRAAGELRRVSHGRLVLGAVTVRGVPAWAVNFPVTRTLAPSLARTGADVVLGSSLAALETALAARAGGIPTLAGVPSRVWDAPAHVAVFADPAGLAAEAAAIVAGLREYGLLAPAAARAWDDVAVPWLAAASTLGRAAVSARAADGGVSLDGELLSR